MKHGANIVVGIYSEFNYKDVWDAHLNVAYICSLLLSQLLFHIHFLHVLLFHVTMDGGASDGKYPSNVQALTLPKKIQ